MLKRALFFATPCSLKLRDGQLVFHTKETPDIERQVPVEDIGVVVLEHPQTNVTLPLLNALSDTTSRWFSAATTGCPTPCCSTSTPTARRAKNTGRR